VHTSRQPEDGLFRLAAGNYFLPCPLLSFKVQTSIETTQTGTTRRLEDPHTDDAHRRSEDGKADTT